MSELVDWIWLNSILLYKNLLIRNSHKKYPSFSRKNNSTFTGGRRRTLHCSWSAPSGGTSTFEATMLRAFLERNVKKHIIFLPRHLKIFFDVLPTHHVTHLFAQGFFFPRHLKICFFDTEPLSYKQHTFATVPQDLRTSLDKFIEKYVCCENCKGCPVSMSQLKRELRSLAALQDFRSPAWDRHVCQEGHHPGWGRMDEGTASWFLMSVTVYPPWKLASKKVRPWKWAYNPKGNDRIPTHPFSSANLLLVSRRVYHL